MYKNCQSFQVKKNALRGFYTPVIMFCNPKNPGWFISFPPQLKLKHLKIIIT